MIGETPNPDDEETYRQTLHPTESLGAHRSMIGESEPFNVSEHGGSPPMVSKLVPQRLLQASSLKKIDTNN